MRYSRARPRAGVFGGAAGEGNEGPWLREAAGGPRPTLDAQLQLAAFLRQRVVGHVQTGDHGTTATWKICYFEVY